MKLGTERTRAILDRLGAPDRQLTGALIAGTNGKGSTCATLTSILEASGLRTGLYTSPHLVDLRERWMVGGQPITEALLQEAGGEVKTAIFVGRTGMAPEEAREQLAAHDQFLRKALDTLDAKK